MIFFLTDVFKIYNTCYSDLCFILRVKSLTFCYKNTKRCLCTWYFRPTLVLIQTINERKDKLYMNEKKTKNLSKEGRREVWPPQEEGGGVGYVFQTRIGKGGGGGIIFTSKYFWGVQF